MMKDALKKTKVVVRKLPPNLKEESFVEALNKKYQGRYNWIMFYPGKSSAKKAALSRAYINFLSPEDVLSFSSDFHGHTFVNEKAFRNPAIGSSLLRSGFHSLPPHLPPILPPHLPPHFPRNSSPPSSSPHLPSSPPPLPPLSNPLPSSPSPRPRIWAFLTALEQGEETVPLFCSPILPSSLHRPLSPLRLPISPSPPHSPPPRPPPDPDYVAFLAALEQGEESLPSAEVQLEKADAAKAAAAGACVLGRCFRCVFDQG
ncbi:unnamed protein product [Closterium sp. Yama58-4]|nr:unnamed protein product [Closterium sp. Yama58-4]